MAPKEPSGDHLVSLARSHKKIIMDSRREDLALQSMALLGIMVLNCSDGYVIITAIFNKRESCFDIV